MKTVDEALKIVRDNALPLKLKRKKLEKSFGRVLGKDLKSSIDVPGYAQSAMDGYAIDFEKWNQSASLNVVGQIAAGDFWDKPLQKGEALRIFTGAPVPVVCDTVVMQEYVQRNGDSIKIDAKKVKQGANVRPQGSQTIKGTLAVKRGTYLDAGTIGYLAGLGESELNVIATPKVGVITTGNELVKPGKDIVGGELYESNSFALQAGLKEIGINKVMSRTAIDQEQDISEALEDMIEVCDLVLFTGGVSVGDFDLVPKILKEAGAEILFHKVAQKPGKPLLFARLGETLIFGLPGNPASVMTCFYIYVWPALQALKGLKPKGLPRINHSLLNAVKRKPGREQFYKAYVSQDGVEVLENQLSYQMDAFAKANALLRVDASCDFLEEGAPCETILLPSYLKK